MRIAPTIELTASEKSELEKVTRSTTADAGSVVRARIILTAAGNLDNVEVAKSVGVSVNSVGKWRRRFSDQRIAGLRDMPRPGRKRIIGPDKVKEIVKKTIEERPQDRTHWSTRSMANEAGVSNRTIARIWKAHELKPHLERTFKLSNDKHFIEKLRDVVGLYMAPPENALVLSVDEKSQIQALDRQNTAWIAFQSRAQRYKNP